MTKIERNHVLVISAPSDESYDPPALKGPFTMEEAVAFAEDFREKNGLPREATNDNNEEWTNLGWYFGIVELDTAIERWADALERPEYTKHTIVIYSQMTTIGELSTLAREAEQGDAICADYRNEQVTRSELPESAASFFQVLDGDEEVPS